MEFYRKSLLLFQLVIVRLVAEGDALAQGMAQKAEEFNRAGGEFYIPIQPV